jgi:hypothetical protein
MGSWFILGTVFAGLGMMFLVRRLWQGYRIYEGLHACSCPADGAPALVKLHASRAAVGVALGRRPSLRVAICSLWPSRANCSKTCLIEIGGNCRLLAQFRADMADQANTRGLRKP